MKKILIAFILFLMFIPNVFAKEDFIVNIYLFHLEDCKYCKEEIELLKEIEKEYDNVIIHKFEINEGNNYELFNNVTRLFNTKIVGTPFTVVGDKYFNGYSNEESKKAFISTIEYYSENGYTDRVGQYLNETELFDIELPSYEIKTDTSLEKYIDNYANYKYNIPLFGKIETNDLDISNNTLLLGIKNIFSYPNLIILFFLIAILIKEKELKNIFILGICFIITSFIINLLPLFNIISLNYNNIKYILSILLIILALYNLLNKKDNNKLYLKLIIMTIITILLNINTFTYSDNHIILKELLYLENISKLLEIIHIIFYLLLVLIDKIIIILLTMILFKKINIENNKLKLLSSCILLVSGIILVL